MEVATFVSTGSTFLLSVWIYGLGVVAWLLWRGWLFCYVCRKPLRRDSGLPVGFGRYGLLDQRQIVQREVPSSFNNCA